MSGDSVQIPLSAEDQRLLQQQANMGCANASLGFVVAVVLCILTIQFFSGDLNAMAVVFFSLLVIGAILSHNAAANTAKRYQDDLSTGQKRVLTGRLDHKSDRPTRSSFTHGPLYDINISGQTFHVTQAHYPQSPIGHCVEIQYAPISRHIFQVTTHGDEKR